MRSAGGNSGRFYLKKELAPGVSDDTFSFGLTGIEAISGNGGR